MRRRITAVSPPVAHLVGPGKLKIANARLAFSQPDGRRPLRMDERKLGRIFAYGDVTISDKALQAIFRHNIEFALFTLNAGKCLGRLTSEHDSSINLRRLQFAAVERPEFCFEYARDLVTAKIDDQLDAARHYQRHGNPIANGVLARLKSSRDECEACQSMSQLRGIEGSSSQAWFHLLAGQIAAPFHFPRRIRRPPTDPVNALLSLGYTWLINRTAAQIRARGLEVPLGLYHTFRAGRPSLACDLMEPHRVTAVDRWVVSMIKQGIFTPDDFRKTDGGIKLQPDSFAPVMGSWEEHIHKVQLDDALYSTVQQLVDHLRTINLPALTVDD